MEAQGLLNPESLCTGMPGRKSDQRGLPQTLGSGFGTLQGVILIAEKSKDRACKPETLILVLRVVRYLIELL